MSDQGRYFVGADKDYDHHSMTLKAERNENAKLNARIHQMEKTISLLNSMVRSGESHSSFSRDMVECSLRGRVDMEPPKVPDNAVVEECRENTRHEENRNCIKILEQLIDGKRIKLCPYLEGEYFWQDKDGAVWVGDLGGETPTTMTLNQFLHFASNHREW